jgi:hypothetical protein
MSYGTNPKVRAKPAFGIAIWRMKIAVLATSKYMMPGVIPCCIPKVDQLLL